MQPPRGAGLAGRAALVTGGSRGIGRAIVLALADAGASVAVNFATRADAAEVAAAEARKRGAQALTVQADVARPDEVEAMVERVAAELGGPDILVNNAGVLALEPFLRTREATWDRVVAVNLKGTFLAGQAAARRMAPRGWGRIINISSIASGQVGIGVASGAAYAATKGGVNALTETMAVELGPLGITVNAIAPGLVLTDMTRGMVAYEAQRQRFLARVPSGRFGTPDDVAAMARFLASEEAAYCNGAVFYVDGGWLAG